MLLDQKSLWEESTSKIKYEDIVNIFEILKTQSYL